MLEKERKYFSEHYEQLASQYFGKFVVIKDEEFIQAFSAVDDALTEGARRFGLQSFLVREVTRVKEKKIDLPALTLGILRGTSCSSNTQE